MKAMKKIVSLLLVLTMAVGLSLTAFADGGTGTLTVTGANLAGKDATVVRMFKAEGDPASYVLESQWQEFFNKQLNKGHDQTATSEEAFAYVNAMKGNDEKVIKFAKEAKAFCYDKGTLKPAFSELSQTEKAASTNTATFANLPAGYYLVLPTGGSTSSSRRTDAILQNVKANSTAPVTMKSEYPTVVKTVNDTTSHGNSARIGENVSFTLTSKVPDMTEYDTYQFIFHDTMSQGLTFNNDVEVTIGGHTLENNTNYKVTADGNSIKIEILDLKNYVQENGITVGTDEIKVTYSATLNKDAQIGTNPNTNVAQVEYSNKPGTTETGKSNPSETKTYSFDIEVHKYANDDVNTLLPGAVFELQDSTGNTIKLVKNSETEYHVADAEEQETGVSTFVTVDDHNIVIKGLKEGKYKLVETKEPDGYNKLTDPIQFEITAEYVEDGSGSPKYAVGSQEATTSNVINVQNRTGAFLPETGSIGTIGLTILGVLLVVGGLGFTSSKKKQQA